MGEAILEENFLELEEPRPGRRLSRSKDVSCMICQQIVAIFEPTDHPKERGLAEMKECLSGQTTTKECNNTFWSCCMQLKKALKVALKVATYQGYLQFGQDHGGEAREQNWYAIQPLNTKTSCWVTSVSPGKTRRKDREDSLSVCREAGKNIWCITMDAADNANMFCRV